jgi:putative endonuclease
MRSTSPTDRFAGATSLLASREGKRTMGDPRHELGLRAEAAVAGWLEQQGWQVLARRWRVAEGEIDLVCGDPLGALVGVEVRLRRSERAGSGLESVDPRHVRRLRAALGRFAGQAAGRSRFSALRIDLVTVSPSDLAGRWRAVRHAAIDAW